MNCEQAIPLLPWLLNGTLADGEAAELREHLRDCGACRRELAATRAAMTLFDTHVPAAELVAHAFGDEPATLGRAELEAHLESCVDCRRELAPIREDASPATTDTHPADPAAPAAGVLPLRPPPRSSPAAPRRWLASAALAAALAAAALGGWWWRTALGSQETAASRPDAALALVELQPDGHAARGAAEAPPTLRRGVAVLLLLQTDDVTPYVAYRLELRGQGGELLWHTDAARRQAAGDFVLQLPAGSLPAGEPEIRLLARQGEGWRPLERYRLHVAP